MVPSHGQLAAVFGLLLWLGASGPSPPPDSVAPCAPCHNRPGDDPVGEWLASPYSQPNGGRQCVDCHGQRCRHSAGGDARDDRTTRLARQSPGSAVRLTVTALCSGDGIEAEVVVANLGAGHDLPTGPPERALVLEVAARSPDGLPLPGAGSHRLRLAPFETDVSRYRFTPSAREPVQVTARLTLTPASGTRLEIARDTAACRAPGAPP